MKYQYRFHTLLLVIIGLLFFSSCDIIDSLKKDKKDDNDGEDQVEFVDGISRDILEFVTQEELAILEDTLGVQIYRGNNPPQINGTFKMSPLYLSKTNIVGDYEIGTRFNDMFLRLYDQDDQLFTIEVDKASTNYDTGEITQTSVGVGSYLIGDGNGFSVFAKVETIQTTGEESVLLELYTGILTEEGIQNLQFALLMLDNNGHDDIFIQNGAGRSFVDGDGLSDLAEFPTSKIAERLVVPKGSISNVFDHFIKP